MRDGGRTFRSSADRLEYLTHYFFLTYLKRKWKPLATVAATIETAMVTDGIYYALAFSAGGALLWYLIHPAFAAPLFLLALFCLYFFRDPDRAIPDGPVAVSPADGKVVGSSAMAPSARASASS